ncbi:MAG: glycosyltransferase family 2 protein [Leptolyngbyaceae cyanobacterium bins.59]|nr:glycosyltransferase family 2 protein [Leptolyngbyaceae cyanobacterium bins.59]
MSAYIVSLKQAIKEIPQLIPLSSISSDYDSDSFGSPKISVIVPAYNEADNIQDCVTSILKSANFLAENIEVWVVDDRSTDKTWIILQALQRSLKDPRLKLISGLPQPEGQKWTGKNWACAQAIKCAEGEFLLFIDADVRLKSGAIESALQVALSEQADLLNCIPAWTCDSLTEWLVQPLMLINLLISLNSKIAKDPKTETAFAAGPFMLFRRSAYEKVGGHEAVADQVAEDVALARLIKHNGLKIEYRLGANIATLRMYRSWGALWEGWTKVLYVGAQRNLLIMLYLAIVMLILYTVPWLGLLIILGKSLTVGLQTIDLLTIGINLIAVFFQYRLRKLATNASNSPPKYWWLQGLGGILVAVIALDSVIKTESGWGWTWRGRALK